MTFMLNVPCRVEWFDDPRGWSRLILVAVGGMQASRTDWLATISREAEDVYQWCVGFTVRECPTLESAKAAVEAALREGK